MDHLVDLRPGLIVRRHDQRAVWLLEILAGDCGESVFAVGNLVDAALRVQRLDRWSDLATRQLFDHRLQGRVFLAHDVLEPGRRHARLLELLIRSPGLDGLVLTHIADQEHAVRWAQAVKECVHLLRARQTRFVEHVEPLLAGRQTLGAGQVPLQRRRRDAGLAQLLRRAGGRREPFDPVAAALGLGTDGREGRRFPGARDPF